MPPPPFIDRLPRPSIQPEARMHYARPGSPPHVAWRRLRTTPRMDKSLRTLYAESMPTPQPALRRPHRPVEPPARPPDPDANHYRLADGCVKKDHPSVIVKPVDNKGASDQVISVQHALKTIVAKSILQSHPRTSTSDRDAIRLRGHLHLPEQPLFPRAQEFLAPESRDFNIKVQGDTARLKENTTSKSSPTAYSPRRTTPKFKSSLSTPLRLAKLISRASRDLLSKDHTPAPTARPGKCKWFPIAPVTFRGEVIGKPKNIDLELAHFEDAPRKVPAVPTIRIAPSRASLTNSEVTVVGECAEGKWRIAEHAKATLPPQSLTYKLAPQPPPTPSGPGIKHPSARFKPDTPLPYSSYEGPRQPSKLTPRRSVAALSIPSTASVYSTTSIDLDHTFPHDNDNRFECSPEVSGPAFFFLPTESPDEEGGWGFMDSDETPEPLPSKKRMIKTSWGVPANGIGGVTRRTAATVVERDTQVYAAQLRHDRRAIR